jgi:hypothetical protein
MGKGPSNQAVPAIVNVFVELDRSPTELWPQLQFPLLERPSRRWPPTQQVSQQRGLRKVESASLAQLVLQVPPLPVYPLQVPPLLVYPHPVPLFSRQLAQLLLPHKA